MVYGSFLKWSFTKVQGFTKNVQLYLGGLLPSAVGGHTFVSALIIKLGLQDPEGCCVFDPNRKSIVKPRDLRAWLSLYHTWQSHSLTNQSFQQGGGWLNSRLCWEERTKFLKASLIYALTFVGYFISYQHGAFTWNLPLGQCLHCQRIFFLSVFRQIPRITLNM